MKQIALLLPVIAVCFLVNVLPAQVSVYGFYNTYSDPSNPLVLGQFEAISGEWLEWDTLDFASAVVVGSSAFDAGTETFMFSGIGVPMETAGMGFWEYDVIENSVINAPSFNQTLNGIQHDMAGDRLFALGTYAADSTFVDFGGGWGYWEYEWGTQLVELNVAAGAVIEIAPIEGINGVILGATAFDPENNLYALVGMDNSYNHKFIQLDAESGAVVSSVNLQLGPNAGFNELECYISGQSYLGIQRHFSTAGFPTEPAELVEVDPLTGALTTLIELPQIHAFTPNASVFEQETGLFIMLYYDVNYQMHVLVLDPVESEVIADHAIEGTFIELQINNREFMVASYGGAVAVTEPEDGLADTMAWPNPANDWLQIMATAPYRILNASGVIQLDWTLYSQIRTSDWPSGSYFIQDAQGATQTIVVQH